MFKSRLEEYTYREIRNEFPYIEIKENIRPPWFTYKDGTRLEIDLYIPEFDIAIEVQGKQHFEFIKHFHEDIESFELRKEYDDYKRFLCNDLDIKYYEVVGRNDVTDIVHELTSLHKFHKAKKFYSKDKLLKWKHRKIKHFLRSCLYGHYQMAINRLKRLNSILAFNKEPTLSIKDIRSYKKAAYPTLESLFGKERLDKKNK